MSYMTTEAPLTMKNVIMTKTAFITFYKRGQQRDLLSVSSSRGILLWTIQTGGTNFTSALTVNCFPGVFVSYTFKCSEKHALLNV